MNVSLAPTTRYLDVGAVALYLGVTVDAIYSMVARRKIPYRKLGRKLMFDVTEVDDYMQRLGGVSAGEAAARMLHDGSEKELAK